MGGFLGIGESAGQRQARKASEKAWRTQLAAGAPLRDIPIQQWEWFKERVRPTLETGVGAIGRRLRRETTPFERAAEEAMYGRARKGITRAGGMARQAMQRRAGRAELTSPAIMAQFGRIEEAEMERMANLAIEKALMNQQRYEQALGTSLGLSGLAPGLGGGGGVPAAPVFGGGGEGDMTTAILGQILGKYFGGAAGRGYFGAQAGAG